MDKSNIILIVISALLLFAIIGFAVPATQPFGFAGYNDLGTGGVTNTSASVSASVDTTGAENTVMAANGARQYARIQNVGTAEVFLHLDPATSTLAVNKGILLETSGADSIYEIGPDNLYFGVIMGLASSTTSTLSVIEK